MKNRWKTPSRILWEAFYPVLLLLCLMMALGMLLGYVACGILADHEEAQLNAYILQNARLFAEAGEEKASFLSVLLIYLRYPVLVFLCGCSAMNAVLIPVVCAVQGFFLSFAVSCFAAQLGHNGILLALSAFGLRCVLVLPCTLMIAVWMVVLKRGLREIRAGKRERARETLLACCFRQMLGCLLVLGIGIILELWLVPDWIALALTKLL